MAKYLLLSILSGILFAISWPTYGIPFFIFFAFVPLMLLQHDIQHFSKNKRKDWKVFGYAYLTFVIWNAVTTGWLYGSLNPDGSHSLPAVVLPVALNSLLMSMVFLFYHKYKILKGTYWGLAFFVALWMGFEQLHLSWELTWPWLNLGNAFSEYPKLIQWYDTVGTTGGSFWILLANVYAFYTFRIFEAGRKRKALVLNSSILLLWLLLPMGISLVKYENFEPKSTGSIRVALLQPELDPYNEKYQKDSLAIHQELMTLAASVDAFKPQYYIAPETALPGYGSFSETGLRGSSILKQWANFGAAHHNAIFLSGISSHRFFDTQKGDVQPSAGRETSVPGVFSEHYNTAVEVLPNDEFLLYHKAKLVPAVEIFPYIRYLKPVLGNIMLDMGGSTASLGTSSQREVFKNPYQKGIAAPIICYESIYGEFVTGYVKKGANFLAIITNDSWWGRTEGHRQLLSYARLRAVETRREIARSANSGISAHIDARGEILESTLYGDKTVLPVTIQLLEGETFYVKAGDWISRICLIILGFLLFYPLAQWIQKKIRK